MKALAQRLNEDSCDTSAILHGRRKRKGHPLHDFREKLLQKWPTIQDAFVAIDSYLSKVTKEMNLQEWAAAMTNLGLASMQDARVIYELLDENKDGDVTLEEFHWGIETVAPVLCMETLRKRLLCLGFPSMMTALSAMHGPGQDMTMLPLSFERFSEYLSRAWVIQPEEGTKHRAIFNSIRNPNDPSQTVTLSELLCGLAGVAPPLVLEDLATALKPSGRLAELKEALGVSNEQEEVSADKWQRILKKMFHFSEIDCKKLLPMMDVDGIDGISVSELKSVLMFAEPTISLEGCRKRVQQGYRSIETVLHTMVDESPDFAEDSKFGKEELQILLESVDGVEMWEMAPVVNFLSGDSVNGISIGGFLKGLRLFAPCCVLEALRMQLLQQGMLTFKEVPNHRAPLDRDGFVASLKRVGVELSTDETSAIFELLDIRSSGVVTISELIALLQCSRPKCRQWRPERELQRQAAFAVHKDFAPIQNGLKELKHGIRVALQEAEEADEQCEDGGLETRSLGNGGWGGSKEGSLGLLVLLPFILFSSLLAISSFTFELFPGLTWAVAMLYLGVSLLFIVVRQSRDGPRFWFHTGSLCFVATILACTCGLWNSKKSCALYWAYEGQRSYEGLAATDRATSYLDAGKLTFRDDVVVDFDRASSHREGSELLCIAPLVNKNAGNEGLIQFWAAGRSCCEEVFNCGDSRRGAKGGLVFLEDALFSGALGQLRAAAKAAETQHPGLRGSPDALFVQQHYWRSGVIFVGCASIVYFVLCVLVGFALHWGVSAPSLPSVAKAAAAKLAAKTLTSSSSAPELRRGKAAPAAPFARRTFQRITSTLSRVPEHENGSKIGEIREELDGYFESHERFVGDHEQLLLQPVPKARNPHSMARGESCDCEADSLAYGAAGSSDRTW
eukprot:s3225_g1.t3